MNFIKVSIITLAAAFTLNACSDKNPTITVKTEIYCNHAATCEESGKPFVDKALTATAGILKANMDVAQKTITVEYDETKIDAQKIKEAITNIGYDADDMKAKPEAYDKLDDCCKKPKVN